MWVKLDDHFVDHPKIVGVGPLAGWLFVAGLCYANRLLTNGFIPENQLPRLLPANGSLASAPARLASKLCASGLWRRAEQHGARGYQIHDYLKYQPSKKQVLTERKRGAERVARWRRRHENAGAKVSRAS
jgi:hypothetical protein